MEKPLVRAVREKSGVVHLSLVRDGRTNADVRDLRDAIDCQRSVSLNFVVPSAGDVSVRLGFGLEIEKVLEEFADVSFEEQTNKATYGQQIISTSPL